MVQRGVDSSGAILETQTVTKEFGGLTAVDAVSLRVQRGSIHGLIGPNGAGKTTFFNLLTKFHKPTSGTITYDGCDITNLESEDIAQLGLVRSFQISAVFPKFTAFENVRIGLLRRHGGTFNFWRSEQTLRPLEKEAHSLLAAVGLNDFKDVPAAELPYGRKRALEIATTLALSPNMILLDEPTSGMTAEDVENIISLIREVSRGRTILMVEHNLSVVSQLCDQITVLVRGRVLAEGNYAAISNDPAVIEAYLGDEHV